MQRNRRQTLVSHNSQQLRQLSRMRLIHRRLRFRDNVEDFDRCRGERFISIRCGGAFEECWDGRFVEEREGVGFD